MKRMTYAGGSIVTGSAVADATLEYATRLARNTESVTVDIPVLEPSGKTTTHTLLLGPASQFDVKSVEALADGDETEMFPVPDFPPIGIVAAEEPAADAERGAKDFNQAVAQLEGDAEKEGI